jgi:predicted dehydrogenase
MHRHDRLSRRRFVELLSASAVGLPLLASTLRGDDKKSANDRLTLGFIGVGTMGRGHLGSHLNNAAVQVVAVCDVVEERREDARNMVEKKYADAKKSGKYEGCKTYNDFRELLARKDIDAVVIATPDHWHAIPVIAAARAKKHIYCEKPLTHSIVEGRHIVDEVAKAEIIFQTGSQQRSEFNNHFRTAVEYVRNGRIGKLQTIRIGVGGPAIPCDLKEEELPEGTDWEMWLGPAPKRAYSSVLCPKGIHKHFPAWRNFREYAGGGLADMGAHHFDIAQWAMDMDRSGPVKVEPPTGKETKGLKFTYANGVEMFHGGEADCVFVGTEGTILASRGKLESKPESILKEPLDEKAFRVYPSKNHRQNWLDCIHSGKATICPAETGHRTATICHLAQIGYELRKTLKWDPMKERFDDDEANKRLDYQRRGDWKL